MKYFINGKESTFKSAILLCFRRMPNACIEDMTKRLTKRLEGELYNGRFVASEYSIYFHKPDERITVKF